MKIYQKQTLEFLQKSSLQIALTMMSVTASALGFMNIFVSLKDPLIIERSCETKIAEIQSANQTREEIENFIKASLSTRFDSVTKTDPALFLTENLQLVRTKEQQELKNKNIEQKVIVRSIKSEQDKFIIEADRLISIGKIRTAVPLDLIVSVASKTRSLSNPYGLVLTLVDQVKSEQTKDDQNGK